MGDAIQAINDCINFLIMLIIDMIKKLGREDDMHRSLLLGAAACGLLALNGCGGGADENAESAVSEETNTSESNQNANQDISQNSEPPQAEIDVITRHAVCSSIHKITVFYLNRNSFGDSSSQIERENAQTLVNMNANIAANYLISFTDLLSKYDLSVRDRTFNTVSRSVDDFIQEKTSNGFNMETLNQLSQENCNIADDFPNISNLRNKYSELYLQKYTEFQQLR